MTIDDTINKKLLDFYKEVIDKSNYDQAKFIGIIKNVKKTNRNLQLINRIRQYSNPKIFNREELGLFNLLPNEMIFKIIKLLNIDDSINLSLTNYSFFLLINDYKIKMYLKKRHLIQFPNIEIDKRLVLYNLFKNNCKNSEMELYTKIIDFEPKFISEIPLFTNLHRSLEKESIDDEITKKLVKNTKIFSIYDRYNHYGALEGLNFAN